MLLAIIATTYSQSTLIPVVIINLILITDLCCLRKILKVKTTISQGTGTDFKNEVDSVIQFLKNNLKQLSNFPIIPTHHSFGEHIFSYLHEDYLIWNVISAGPRYLPLSDTFPFGHSTQILPETIKKYKKSLKLNTLSVWLHKNASPS